MQTVEIDSVCSTVIKTNMKMIFKMTTYISCFGAAIYANKDV